MGYKETLLSPIKIGGRVCRNRFFAQPMECVDSDAEGNPTEMTLRRYENLYKGKFGFVDLEAITVKMCIRDSASGVRCGRQWPQPGGRPPGRAQKAAAGAGPDLERYARSCTGARVF